MSKKTRNDREAFLGELRQLWPLAKGSLTQVRNRCIRPGCPACARGEKHLAYHYAFVHKGRQRCMYVPRGLVPLLQQAIQNGQRLEERLAELGAELIREYRQQRDGKRRPPSPDRSA